MALLLLFDFPRPPLARPRALFHPLRSPFPFRAASFLEVAAHLHLLLGREDGARSPGTLRREECKDSVRVQRAERSIPHKLSLYRLMVLCKSETLTDSVSPSVVRDE